MTAPTRRQLMAASLAAVGAAGAPAVAAIAAPSDSDRAEWLGLWQDFLATEALAADEHSGLDEDTISKLSWAAQRAIRDKPSMSMAGVAVKLALWLRVDVLIRIGDTIDSADPQHEYGIAAYRDACRLAGISEDLWQGGAV